MTQHDAKRLRVVSSTGEGVEFGGCRSVPSIRELLQGAEAASLARVEAVDDWLGRRSRRCIRARWEGGARAWEGDGCVCETAGEGVHDRRRHVRRGRGRDRACSVVPGGGSGGVLGWWEPPGGEFFLASRAGHVLGGQDAPAVFVVEEVRAAQAASARAMVFVALRTAGAEAARGDVALEHAHVVWDVGGVALGCERADAADGVCRRGGRGRR